MHKKSILMKQIALFSLLLTGVLLSLGVPNAAQAQGGLVINEMMSANPSAVLDPEFVNFSDWIELYNGTADPIDLSGYFLTDDPINIRQWKFPVGTVIPANGYLLVWADGENAGLHTNFKLSEDGEIIILSTPTEVEVTRLDYTAVSQKPDIAYGRATDGVDSWLYFDQPTPGASNETAVGLPDDGRAPRPDFSLPSGHYNGDQIITLSLPDGVVGEIRYTADGSIPTITSPIYTDPIVITQTTPLRARTYQQGVALPSNTETHTYLLNIGHTLPIITLSANPEYFFSDEMGIYIEGPNYDPHDPENTANYYRAWTRALSMEFFETDGSPQFQIDAGVEIFGNWTRRNDIKSLEIKMGSDYGDSWLEYPLFNDVAVDRFKSIVLRNSGGDWHKTYFRDALTQSLVEGRLDIDTQGYRPAIVYLNGEFWGIHNIREKQDENYLREHYDVDPDAVDIIVFAETPQAGTRTEMRALRTYLETHDLSIAENYDYVMSRIEVNNFLDYQISQIYVDNRDWPHNNVRAWRTNIPDGRWRWMMYDTDAAWGHYDPYNHTYDTLTWATNNTTNRPDLKYTLFLRKLLENQGFRDEFIQRFASHINITFDPSRVVSTISGLQATLQPEMPAHIAKWGSPSSMNNWQNSRIPLVVNFANNRPPTMFTHINNYFALNGTAALTVQTIGEAGDTVRINSVAIPQAPFTGPYFKDVPIRLEAVPQTGQSFSHWEIVPGVPVSTDLEYFYTITDTASITAVFAALPPVVINEIHYHPASFQGDEAAYEFIELHNPSLTPIDLSGYYMDGIVYTFTVGTTIAPGQYLVLAQTAATYAGQGYTVYQWHSGGLNNSGETVRLYTSAGYLLDEVPYQDSLPWPTEPDGDGPSLSLISPNLDNALPSSWEPSAIMGGTPGGSNTAVTHPIILTEFHYNPNEDIQGSDADYEFLELYNAGAITVTLAGYQISNGIAFTFPAGAQLGPNKYLLVAKNSASYPSASCTVYQWASGSLDNAGELVRLVDNNGVEVDAVVYDDAAPWPTAPDGDGPSLDLRSASLNNALASSWMASAAVGGSPCASSVLPDPSAVTLRLASASTTHTSTHGFALFILGYVLLASASWVLLNAAVAPAQGKQ